LIPVVARWALTTGYYLSQLRREEALKPLGIID
jgi:hypothetical protein